MKKNSIIGKLYNELKSNKLFGCKNQSKFLVFLGVDSNYAEEYTQNCSYAVTYFFGYDYYESESKLIDLEKFRKHFDDNKILDKMTINKILCDILESDIKYAINNPRKKENINIVSYNEKDKKKLLLYYKSKQYCFDLSYNIYLILHLALYKKLPDNFYYGANYEKALSEFNEEVIKLYGATSEPSTRAILYLASKERSNIFALYEKAEMFYYGNRNNVHKDLVKAYEIYKVAAGIDPVTQIIEKTDKTFCHPLALWTLSYILFNYRRKDTDLENCQVIPELIDTEHFNQLSRVERAIIYAQTSYEFIENGPSANILGKIALLTEEELPGINSLRQKYNMQCAEEYFTMAAEKGYVYAINNMAGVECEKIFTDTDNKQIHLNNALKYFHKSALQYEPWACNTLGEIYRTGIVKRRNSNDICKFDIINKEEAFKYYILAISCFINNNSAWAYYNLLVYYPKEILKKNLLCEYVTAINEIDNKDAIDKLKLNWPSDYGVGYEDVI